MSLKTDVIIIGGGVIGLCIGYYLAKNAINTIILVGGYHFEHDHSKSEEYVQRIKQFFENNFRPTDAC